MVEFGPQEQAKRQVDILKTYLVVPDGSRASLVRRSALTTLRSFRNEFNDGLEYADATASCRDYLRGRVYDWFDDRRIVTPAQVDVIARLELGVDLDASMLGLYGPEALEFERALFNRVSPEIWAREQRGIHTPVGYVPWMVDLFFKETGARIGNTGRRLRSGVVNLAHSAHLI